MGQRWDTGVCGHCSSFILSFYKQTKKVFIFGCADSAAALAFLQLQGVGFSCCWARALGCPGFSGCSTWALVRPWAPEHRLNSCGAQGLADLWHVGSSRTRDETCVSCIGRQILYHWATREAQFCPFLISYFSVFPALLKNDKIVVFLKCTVWYTYTLWEGFHRLVNGHPFLQGVAGAWTP